MSNNSYDYEKSSQQDLTTWEEYSVLLSDLYEKIEQNAKKIFKNIKIFDCPKKGASEKKKKKFRDDQACLKPCPCSKLYSIEENNDGYWRVRFLKKDKNPTIKKYRRKRRNGTYYDSTRKVYERGAIYLTHLALLYNGVDLVKKRTFKRPIRKRKNKKVKYEYINIRYSVSHLCGNRWCFNVDHLRVEPHRINTSRISCYFDICKHKEKCLNDSNKIKRKVRRTQRTIDKIISDWEEIEKSNDDLEKSNDDLEIVNYNDLTQENSSSTEKSTISGSGSSSNNSS